MKFFPAKYNSFEARAIEAGKEMLEAVKENQLKNGKGMFGNDFRERFGTDNWLSGLRSLFPDTDIYGAAFFCAYYRHLRKRTRYSGKWYLPIGTYFYVTEEGFKWLQEYDLDALIESVDAVRRKYSENAL